MRKTQLKKEKNFENWGKEIQQSELLRVCESEYTTEDFAMIFI